MAFGFPAFHKDRKTLTLSVEETKAIAIEILVEFEWTEIGIHPFALDYKTTGGILTSGERLYINITETEIILRSECIFMSQFLDFGKNKANIDRFWEAYEAKLKNFKKV